MVARVMRVIDPSRFGRAYSVTSNPNGVLRFTDSLTTCHSHMVPTPSDPGVVFSTLRICGL